MVTFFFFFPKYNVYCEFDQTRSKERVQAKAFIVFLFFSVYSPFGDLYYT